MLPSGDVNHRLEHMARVLVVDDEALTRTMVADMVRSCGHDADIAASGEAGFAAFQKGGYGLVLTDVTMPGMDGIELGCSVKKWFPDTPVVLVSSNDELSVFEDAARRGFLPSGFVRKPLDRDLMVATLERLLPPVVPVKRPDSAASGSHSFRAAARGGAAEDDGESGWLQAAAAPAAVIGPMRLLFVAFRQRAGGQLRWTGPGGSVSVGVRGGDVVAVEGLPGLFRTAGLSVDIADLQTGIQVGLSQALGLEFCLEAASEGLAGWMCALQDDPEGEVRWDAGWAASSAALPLPGSVARWCGQHIAKKSLSRLELTWSKRARLPVQRRIPGDSPEAAWGLDPLSMRVHRLATAPRSVRALLDEVANGDDGRRIAGLRSVDLLNSLGLLQSDDYLPHDMTTSEVPQVDLRVETLREASRRLVGRSPVAVLDLADRVDLTEDDVVRAFRQISRNYHPDTFFGAPPSVRALAEQCFSIVNAAYDALREPGALAELKKRREAEKAGGVFSTERDLVSARIAFRKGEVLWRARDFRSADPHLALAAKLDPKTWPYLFLAAQCGYYAKRLTLPKSLEALDALIVADPVLQGEIQSAAGNMLKLEGRVADAQVRYKRALDKDPTNRDALRERRLIAARAPSPAPQSIASQIAGLFKRK
ncbi:MAG: response regulator [Myxococcales bacterium]|nr:response regulator [Myxococcales bacterium]